MFAPNPKLQPTLIPPSGDLSIEQKEENKIKTNMNQLSLNVRLSTATASVIGAVIVDALTESPEEKKKRLAEEQVKREEAQKEREKLAKQLKDAEDQVKLLLSAKGRDPNSLPLNRSLNPTISELKELLALAAKEKEALNKV